MRGFRQSRSCLPSVQRRYRKMWWVEATGEVEGKGISEEEPEEKAAWRNWGWLKQLLFKEISLFMIAFPISHFCSQTWAPAKENDKRKEETVHRSLTLANYWPASGEEGWKGLYEALHAEPSQLPPVSTVAGACIYFTGFLLWDVVHNPCSKHAVADCSVLERRHSSRFVVLFRNPLASVNQICHGDRSFKEKLILVNAS